MSSVVLDASVVIKACEKHIKECQEFRKEKREEVINKIADQRQFPKFWKKNGRDLAIHLLENNWHQTLDSLYIRYGLTLRKMEDEEIAEDLLVLAKLGNPVTITEKHAFIFKD